jgi:hypothetical protein
MKQMTGWKALPLGAVLACIATAAAAVEPRWMLMSRHGECAEVATLKRRIPDLGGIADPAAFADRMRRDGHRVSSRELALPGGGRAVEVKVPEKELGLLFVPDVLCAKKP